MTAVGSAQGVEVAAQRRKLNSLEVRLVLFAEGERARALHLAARDAVCDCAAIVAKVEFCYIGEVAEDGFGFVHRDHAAVAVRTGVDWVNL